MSRDDVGGVAPGGHARGPVLAVVPLRDGSSGKTRLAERFDDAERARLVTLLARHVVGTLLDAPAVAGVLVVTGDPEFAADALPTDPRLRVLAQAPDRRGLNEAVALGQEAAVADGAARVLVIHADLPLLTPDDVAALLAPDAPVVIAPDGAGSGTNALVLGADVHDFVFRFGVGSCAAHYAEAAALGLATAVVQRSGTATDLDTPADWLALPDAVRARLGG